MGGGEQEAHGGKGLPLGGMGVWGVGTLGVRGLGNTHLTSGSDYWGLPTGREGGTSSVGVLASLFTEGLYRRPPEPES